MKSKKPFAFLFSLILLLSLLLASTAMAASPSLTQLTYDTEVQGVSIALREVGGAYYLFLPASADLTALTLTFDGPPATGKAGEQSLTIASGEPFDLSSLYTGAPADGVYSFSLSRGGEEITVKVMVSANLASMYIISDDPVAAGRAYVEEVKVNKATGQMTLLDADGSVIYSGGLTQIKGRGNTTWKKVKKPYQIKLAAKTDLMETGEANEAAKTWVLLANYLDSSLLRDTLSYHLAADFGLAYSPNCRPVDLYYDGEYRGSYLLSEKTEVGKGRVAVHDLEEDFEDANPQVEDFDDLATASGVNAYGNSYQYVTGLTDPEDLSGGYLLEIDLVSRVTEEKSYFTTSHGYSIVSKSPEYLSQTAMEYISEFYQEFEDAVFHGGVNPNTGKNYTDYVDLDSLVRYYLVQELTQNVDAFLSSTFFYKPAGEEKLYVGPVWDFDTAFGNSSVGYSATDIAVGRTLIGRALLSIPSFCEALGETYRSELHPLVADLVLSSDPSVLGDRLRSLAGYSAEVTASWQMDAVLWHAGDNQDFHDVMAALRTFLAERDPFLYALQWSELSDTVPSYTDVPTKAWYYAAVEYLTAKGILKGVTNGVFQPNSDMTRLATAVVLYRLAGSPATEGTCAFADVTQGPYYETAVAWATEQGLIQGYPDGTFRPNVSINRREMVTLLYRYAQLLGLDVTASPLPETYTDRDSVRAWAMDAFAWAVDRGLITGTSSTLLSPTLSASRGMMAAIIYRFDQLITAEVAE